MIRLLHAADLHLDTPFQGLGREKALQRRAEQRQLFARIGDLARQRQADLVVLSGDLFDSGVAFSETEQTIERVLNALDVPVFIAPGNHDWYGPRSAWTRLRLGEHVHLFTEEAIRCVALPDLGVRVWGSAFTGPYREPPLVSFEATKDGDTLDILAIHGQVGELASPYGAISEQELARSGMDYVALGHVHSYSGLRRAGETFYAWPGCPEGRGFDETGDKGVLLAQLEPGACELEFIPLGGRKYEMLSVDISQSQDILATVESALPADTARDVYRIRLTGQTDQTPPLSYLQRALEGRFFGLELADETGLRRDIWAQRGSDSLQGLFLAQLWQRLENASSDQERELVTQAARWGLQAMDGGEELPL